MYLHGRFNKVAATVAALLLTACSVGPDYVRPTPVVNAPMPAAFKETDQWKFAQPKDGRVQPGWWKMFNDPLLNSLEEQVVINNQNIAAASAQLRQAKAIIAANRAAYFPTIGTTPAVTRSQRSGNLSTVSSTSTAAATDYNLPLDLSWEIDVWGRIRRTVEASRDNAQASQADLAAATLSAQAELAQDYFLLRIQDLQKKLLADAVASYQKALELTRNRYAGGIVAKSDLLQAETQLKTTQAEEIDLEVQRAQLEHAIALLVGKPASSFSIPVAPLATLFPQIPVGFPSQLLERRPDIAAAERRMASANAQIGVAQAAYYPNVQLSASAGLEAISLANWFSWPSRFWALGAAVSETLFDGGLRRAQTEEARAAYDATVANYRQTVLTAFQDVEDNLAALRVLAQEAEAQDAAVKASEASLAVSLNQYRGGIISYLNVIVAQNTALSNERTAVTLLGRRLTSSVLLIKGLGGGWDAAELGGEAGTAKK